MASDINDLRAHALHQKSKEPPEVPRITKEEAAVLANDGKSFDDAWDSLTDSGMLEFSLTDGDVVDIRASPLGRAALAQFEAEQRAEILAPVVASKDAAYHERDMLVCLLSKLYPSHLCRHPDEHREWEDDWRWIVCVHLPTGQATWHIHDSERALFDHLPVGESHWDGHSTEEKYERVARITGSEQSEESRRAATACHALIDAARRLDDVEQRRVRLSDTDFDALDDAWHGAIADVCRAVREVQP